MGMFSLFLLFSFFFLALYLTIYILGMTTDYISTKKITRNRKRPKKTSINSTIVREVFNEQHRKELEIPLFIDCYNYYMNSVNVTN
jgi:predicted membrane protein